MLHNHGNSYLRCLLLPCFLLVDGLDLDRDDFFSSLLSADRLLDLDNRFFFLLTEELRERSCWRFLSTCFSEVSTALRL
jgi:hypothetical protein